MEGSSYSMLSGRYKQSEGKKALSQRANTSHNPSLTIINTHLGWPGIKKTHYPKNE